MRAKLSLTQKQLEYTINQVSTNGQRRSFADLFRVSHRHWFILYHRLTTTPSLSTLSNRYGTIIRCGSWSTKPRCLYRGPASALAYPPSPHDFFHYPLPSRQPCSLFSQSRLALEYSLAWTTQLPQTSPCPSSSCSSASKVSAAAWHSVFCFSSLPLLDVFLTALSSVNTFYRIGQEPQSDPGERGRQEREFKIGSIGFADSLGILCASLLAVPTEVGLCNAQAARGKMLCKSL